MLRTIMEIRARPTSLTAMPRRAFGVISSRVRWKDHFSISSVSLADLGGKNDQGLHRVSPCFEQFGLTSGRCFVFDDDEHRGKLSQLGARSSSI
jgi:hypothetical protein